MKMKFKEKLNKMTLKEANNKAKIVISGPGIVRQTISDLENEITIEVTNKTGKTTKYNFNPDGNALITRG